MFLIDFFYAEIKSDECQLEKFEHFCIFKVKGQFQVKYVLQQMKLGTSVILHFYVILTGQSISEIILIIQGDLQGQKGNFKVK